MENLNLKYDFNALCELEEKSEMGILEIIESKKGNYTMRLMVWAGLLHENNRLTIKEAGEILNKLIQEGNTLNDIATLIFKALEKSGVIGKQEDKKVDGDEEKN